MKKSLLYIAMILSAAGFIACDGDLERPPMIEPSATIKPNTTIASLKADVWQTDRNYVAEVGQRNGRDIIIAGRVVSNDKAGNVFKNIVLQDETGAITVSINAYDLYQTYQQGQQIVVNVTGLKIGGYNGLLQIGGEGTYNGAPSMTFIDKELFAEHAQQNGLARPERIDTITTTISELTTAKGSVDGLQKWQSQFIRIDNVSFENAGQPFAGSSNADRYVKDDSGNRINVRNSSYADFSNDILPSGKGSIAGILSYYGTDWQIILNDVNGCIGFEPATPAEPVEGGDGTLEKPYTVAQVKAGTTGTGWVVGYIVGSVTDISYDSAVIGTENASTTNILIAAKADETNPANCVPVQLPIGTVRDKLNLANNPDNLSKAVKLNGSFETYFGTAGIKAVTEFDLEGYEAPTPAEGVQFKAVTAITSGKSYLLIADGKIARPITNGTYGYLQVEVATITDGTVTADPAYALTFETVNGGYTIKQYDGKYYYATDQYNNISISETIVDGCTWAVTFDNSAAVITSTAVNKSIQYDAKFNSYGAYSDVRGTFPALYEKVD